MNNMNLYSASGSSPSIPPLATTSSSASGPSSALSYAQLQMSNQLNGVGTSGGGGHELYGFQMPQHDGGSGQQEKQGSVAPSTEGGDEDAEEEARRRRKRAKLVLSCSECKRRKIKCDRNSPCEACIRRGDQKKCHWEASKIEPAPQPFVLTGDFETLKHDHEELRRRLTQLESLVLGGGGAGAILSSRAGTATGSTPGMDGGASLELNGEGELPDSDTEEAALGLEELALGRQLGRMSAKARKRLRKETTMVHPPALVPTGPTASLLVEPPVGRRKASLDFAWEVMPKRRSVREWLVNWYFTKVAWAWTVLHRPRFLRELQAFEELVAAGRRDEVDPIWLSTLFSVLCLSSSALDDPLDSTLTDVELTNYPDQMFDAAESCLEAGDWLGRPRVRTLQAIALFSMHLAFGSTASSSERHRTYLGAAIRMCQQMNFHHLGYSDDTMPPLDPALPVVACTLRRQLALRVFSTLLYMDWQNVKLKPAITPENLFCAAPGNYSDIELDANGIAVEKPPDVVTEISFELVKFKLGLEKHNLNRWSSGPTEIEYSRIMEVDAAHRKILSDLPSSWSENYVPPPDEPEIERWRRAAVIQLVYSRLIRMHRPWMSSGFKDPRFAFSVSTSLEAARKVLEVQKYLEGAPLIKSAVQFLNVRVSMLALYMNIWNVFPEGDLATYPDFVLIQSVRPLFNRFSTSRQPTPRRFAQQSLQTINLLEQALHERRAHAEERKKTGGPWRLATSSEESFGNLLRRVGTVVAASAAAGTTAEDILSAATKPTSISLSTPEIVSFAPPPSWDVTPGVPAASGSYFTTDKLDFDINVNDLDLDSILGQAFEFPSSFTWMESSL